MTTHHTYVVILVFLTALATAFMAARFVAKHVTKVNLTNDDALLVAASVSALQGSLYPQSVARTHARQLLMYALFAGAILGMSCQRLGRRHSDTACL
jgi:hypothetical protein